MIASSVEALWLSAWIDGLHRVNAAERPQEGPAPVVRLDTPGRAPFVLLRPAGGDRAQA